MDVRITDTRLHIETPEGTDLPLDPAGVGVRTVAFLIDLLIRFAIMFALGFVLAYLGDFGVGMWLILFFLIDWFYPVYFEVWRKGATPGKKNVGILVVNDDGTPVKLTSSLIRNLLRFIDNFPIIPMPMFGIGLIPFPSYVVGVFTIASGKSFKRLGDYAAGTLVVYAQPQFKRPEIDEHGKAAVPADFDIDEQRALIAFAERSRTLSLDRQRELADVLAPVINDSERIKTIKQMANSLVGAGEKREQRYRSST